MTAGLRDRYKSTSVSWPGIVKSSRVSAWYSGGGGGGVAIGNVAEHFDFT